MIDEDRDLSVLVVPAAGAVEAGNDLWEPVRLIDSDGEPVVAVLAFLRERQARPGAEVRRVDAGALGDGAAGVLRLPSRRRDGSDGQPVPAVAGTGRWSGARPSQPDGAVQQRAGGALSAAGRAAGPARHPRRVVQPGV